MHAYRRAARRTAWKDPEDHGAFNPFAVRGPQRSLKVNNDAEALWNIRTISDHETPETVVETTQAELNAEDEAFSAELKSDNQADGHKSPMHNTTVLSSEEKKQLHPTVEAEVMPDDTVDMKIAVKTTGKSLEFIVRPVTTIYELKELIQDRVGIVHDQQRIISGGRQRKNAQTLKECGILPNGTVYLVLRLRGGGSKESTDHEQDPHAYNGRQVVASITANARSRRRKFIFKRNNAVEEVKSEPPEQPQFTFIDQARMLLFNSWWHLLLLFIPAGFAVNYCHENSVVVFCINFIAIIPSAMNLSLAVGELSLRTGELLEGIISMTFSNAIQLITSIFLLKNRQVDVLKTSLIGTILSNLLLMNGLALFVGGCKRVEQFYNRTVAQLLGSLLLLAFLSLMIPTASSLLSTISLGDVVRQSRGTAIMLLSSYVLWLLYQFKTHRDTFAPAGKAPLKSHPKGTATKGIAKMGAASAAIIGGAMSNGKFEDDDDEEEFPQLSLWTSIGATIVLTVLIAFNTQFATDTINGLLNQAGLSTTFVGLVILPLLNNDPTTLKTAQKDKMDLSIALTIEKCMQTALMVIPLVIIIAWPMGVDEMTLSFNSFEVVSLFASILIVNYIIQDGTSNWLQGALLVEAYIIVSIAAYFVPGSE